MKQGISEPELYGDLVYIIRKMVGKSNFAEQFRKLINRYKKNRIYPIFTYYKHVVGWLTDYMRVC